MKPLIALLLACLSWPLGAAGFPDARGQYPFGVLNQRSLTLTAAYWNPILRYVSAKSGVPLVLRIARTADETTDMAVRGELAFVYSNHFFAPPRDRLGFRVLARQAGEGIRGQVVVLDDAPYTSLDALAGRPVAFANPYAMTGYYVPMDGLLRAGVTVRPVFAGNQEAAMAQLRLGKVAAAGVNDKVMANYSRRENLRYRVLYESEPYLDLAIMAHPTVPDAIAASVRAAFVGMAADPEGRRVLDAAAASIGAASAPGFVAAANADYDNYRRFFRHTRVPLDGR